MAYKVNLMTTPSSVFLILGKILAIPSKTSYFSPPHAKLVHFLGLWRSDVQQKKKEKSSLLHRNFRHVVIYETSSFFSPCIFEADPPRSIGMPNLSGYIGMRIYPKLFRKTHAHCFWISNVEFWIQCNACNAMHTMYTMLAVYIMHIMQCNVYNIYIVYNAIEYNAM